MPGPPAETPYRFFSLLGMVSSGDLGDITCYRSHLGKIVIFSKTWPQKLASMQQITGRSRMYFGAEQWRGFTANQKQLWRNAVDDSSLSMSGYNLWQKWWMNPNYDAYFAIMHQTGINVLHAITRTPPTMPPPAKFEPHEIADARWGGHLRYGRKTVVMPYSTTEYLPFMCYNPEFPDGETIPTWWTIYGLGSIDPPLVVQNNHWCVCEYTSPDEAAHAVVEMKSEWPDGDTDICRVNCFTRYF